jgi:hypothetical protein
MTQELKLKPVAADVSPAYAGMAAREHAMSAPGGDAHGVDMTYLAQQQNVMVAPQPASVAPPMRMVMVNLVAAQIDQQRNVMATPQLASVVPPMGMVTVNPIVM